MHPIIYPDNTEGSPKAISEYILRTCEEHKAEGRALAFSFIISDLKNPYVNKILRDTDYLNSLHEISGKDLTIFFLNDNYVNKTLNKAKDSNVVKIQLSVQPIDGTPDIRPKHLAELLINDNLLTTPSILFFQVENYEVTDYFVCNLVQNKIEEGFNEIKDVISVAIESFSKVEDENRKNFGVMFDLLKSNVEASEYWKNVKKKYEKAMKIKDFLFFWK